MASTVPKFFLNSLENSVLDNLYGIALANPEVQVVPEVDAIVLRNAHQRCQQGLVFVVSGGGAGHEPMFAGFVGANLLTAAISGSYFASPSAGKLIKLVEEFANPNTPVLFILANYTGDRLNFGLAKEYLTLKGYKNVRLFIFSDDISPFLVEGSKPEEIDKKRRGLAGIWFIHRIAGVLADQGKSLDEIESRLLQSAKLIFTISISLSACDIPGHGASFQLKSDEMELGLGVHGESGIKRVPLLSAHDTIKLMVGQLVDYLNKQNLLDQYKRQVALIINNLGGLTQIELNVVLKEVLTQMADRNVTVLRLYFGPYMTSFNMKGVSLSLMLLDDQTLNILDQGEKNSANIAPKGLNNSHLHHLQTKDVDPNDAIPWNNFCEPNLYRLILSNACKAIIGQEHTLNTLDETVGDSDCGSTMSAIAKLFLDQIQSKPDQLPSFANLARIVSERIGGSSGALYSLLFTSAFNYIRQQPDSFSRTAHLTNCDRAQVWAKLVRHCMNRISTYSGAKVNDRSMIDALHGIVIGLEQGVNSNGSLSEICRLLTENTWKHAKATASMKARVGRAAYVNESYITKPDAGAMAVAVWIEEVANTLRQTLSNEQ